MKNWERWLLPFGLVGISLLVYPDYTTTKWLGVYLLALLASGVALFLKPVVPDLEKKEWIGLQVLGLLVLAHFVWFQSSGYQFALLGRLSFFLLAWSAWRGFSAQLRWVDFWWPLAGLILVQSAYIFFLSASTGRDPGLFGAELLGSALVLFWAIPGARDVHWQIARAVAGAAGLAALSLTDISVLGGVFAAVVVLGFWRRPKGKALFLPALTLFLAFAAWVALNGGQAPSLQVAERVQVWRAALDMIRANPLGVGLDRFSFVFPSFHRLPGGDHRVLLSPQNEFLRWMSEDGPALFLIFALVAVYLVRRWWRNGAEEKVLVSSVGAFYAVQMFTGAPWQSPFPMTVGALVFGAMAAGTWKRRMLPAHAGARASLMMAWIFLFFCFGRALISRTWETSDNLFRARVACRAVPANWRACLSYSQALLAQGETTAARREAENVLEVEPGNFVAIRHLAAIALKQGDPLEACFHTWRYDDMFSGQSELSEQYVKNCPPKWRDYFTRKRPKKYYPR